MLSNYGAGEDSWESLKRQGFQACELKGNQPWRLIVRTDAKAETQYFGHWLIGKNSDARKDRKQREKRVADDEMVGWHHWLNEHKFEQTPGDNEEQGSLACCCSWGRKELGHNLGTEWWQQPWRPRLGLISFRKIQRFCYVYSLRRNQDFSLSLYYCFLIWPLFLHSLFSLISNCLNLLFGTERGSRSWKKKCN